MKPIEFILSYLKSEATPEERQQIRDMLKMPEAPPIEPQKVLENLLSNCRKMYDGTNRLNVVKFTKDVTGWGLKESKDWCDSNIFLYKIEG